MYQLASKNGLANKYLLFTLDNYRYGLPVTVIDRVIKALEITPLPKATEIILGIINVQGNIIPVINVRKRFQLKDRNIDINDHIIIVNTLHRRVALIVDGSSDMIEITDIQIVEAKNIIPDSDHFRGVAKTDDETTIILDLEKFLSLDEEEVLQKGLLKINKENEKSE